MLGFLGGRVSTIIGNSMDLSLGNSRRTLEMAPREEDTPGPVIAIVCELLELEGVTEVFTPSGLTSYFKRTSTTSQ